MKMEDDYTYKLLMELIIQLNLNGKRFAIERNGEIISKNYFNGLS